MSAIRCALVGYGVAGSMFHAPILGALDGFALTDVVSSRPAAVRADLPGVAVHADLDGLLAISDVELCVIATLNASHAPLARACLEAGRHVVVEKPFVTDPAEGRALAALAAERGLVLAVYHSRRWDGDFLTLRRLIADGKVGVPHTLIAHYDRWRPTVQDRWRERPGPGAGILWDLGAHLVDQALQLLGPARRVCAELSASRPGASVTDHFHLVVEHAGATAYLHGDCRTVLPGPHFILHGSAGSFVKYGMDSQEALLRQRLGPGTPGWGIEPEASYGDLTVIGVDGQPATTKVATERGGYEAFYLGLARALRAGAPSPVSAAEALAVIDLLLAAEESAASGQRIDLPPR